MSRIAELAGQIGESVLSVAGIRTVEEPRHISRTLTGGVEIRRYGRRIAAQTTVVGERDDALTAGFRTLAGYIFGGNRSRTEIAMTAPVSQQSGAQKIAMTAPVSQSGGGEDGWTIRFFMPSQWTLQTLPEPDDDDVRLVSVPAETVAVLRFTGDRGPAAVARRTDDLLQALGGHGIAPAGEAVAWFYDPPWTLPFLRRNEVVVPI
ncbi:heme-binding protein [Mycolicibacterium bacteremicum]|uniref:SOUL family heme-binding protein n=1 Tax=Mycolicibacterium bacteremicum TaxID=564198 RepID=UPI0026F2C623|nr:heme-binding protein [Mycolicibacterium bacteremicum]